MVPGAVGVVPPEVPVAPVLPGVVPGTVPVGEVLPVAGAPVEEPVVPVAEVEPEPVEPVEEDAPFVLGPYIMLSGFSVSESGAVLVGSDLA